MGLHHKPSRKMTLADLQKAARLLYGGERHAAALAAALGIQRDTASGYLCGRDDIPASLWPKIALLLENAAQSAERLALIDDGIGDRWSQRRATALRERQGQLKRLEGKLKDAV